MATLEPGWLGRMDPELAPVVPLLPETDLQDIVAARQGLRDLLAGIQLETPGLDRLTVEDVEVPGLGGAPAVPVRVYRPVPGTDTPAGAGNGSSLRGADGRVPGLVWIHGGGFMLGELEMEHAGAVAMSAELGAVVVSVEYRLAPEHSYPAGLDDCMAALHWLIAGAERLGVDTGRVGVGGISAGGGLSAAVALRARDEGGPELCFQFLGIPEIDDRMDTPSMREFADTPLWNSRLARVSWRAYLGDGHTGAATDDVPVYAAPSRATDLAGLPPAFISTAELDPLRDEGILYGMALLAAGVSVELHQYPGTFHGFQLVVDSSVGAQSRRDMMAALRRGLAVRPVASGR